MSTTQETEPDTELQKPHPSDEKRVMRVNSPLASIVLMGIVEIIMGFVKNIKPTSIASVPNWQDFMEAFLAGEPASFSTYNAPCSKVAFVFNWDPNTWVLTVTDQFGTETMPMLLNNVGNPHIIPDEQRKREMAQVTYSFAHHKAKHCPASIYVEQPMSYHSRSHMG